ncbi:MAG: branched-chain amino acid ABC transporter permease [Caldilineaceae bacterium SB0662_bin_9]|uniref:Branched-chain amino acid ABC transporter permease n=1 Tax=Caldilineaceae bacterium SB0662_bin_9 TaxID=2605258 RepID=A0A6B1DR73_9CHLR|nr:branched-chain amino acid ABC transporter permease [Caldilineaceae bacterium SB0662_bin_9]
MMARVRDRLAQLGQGWGGLGLWWLLLVALALYPYTGVTHLTLFLGSQVFVLVTLASNWNLIGGMTGYVDFGHAVFFGIGAYVMGILVTTSPLLVSPEWGFLQALPVSGAAAAIFALLIGLPTLRLKGPYFSIAMLGTFVAMREIVRVLRPLTGGGVGLNLPPVLNRLGDYYLMLVLMGLVVSIMWWIRRSEFGQSLIAIREDEIGAEMRGINTTLHKIAAFMIAAFFTGVVGGFWAWQNTFIDPDVVFIETRTVEMVMMSMLGGLGTVWGPPLGAVVIYVLQTVVWGRLFGIHLLVLGILMVLLVLFLPEGILGTSGRGGGTSIVRLWGRIRQRSDP